MKRRLTVSMLLAGAITVSPRAWGFPAPPTLTDVTSSIIVAGGTAYYDVEATLRGTGHTGAGEYSVPVTFLYPVDPDDCNGTAIVDLLNNSAMVLLKQAGVIQAPLPAARARLTEDFIGRKGYVYMSVQWELARGALAIFNQNFGTSYVIPSLAHQYAIILDAATAVRSPIGGLPGSPCPVGTVAAYGMSASTVPLNILKQPALDNLRSFPGAAAAFASLYDGMIWDSLTGGFLQEPVSKTGVKTVAVSAETDVMLFGNHIFVRGQNPSYRSYEVAGVTHVSRDEHKLDDIVPKLPPPPVLPTRQNLATHSPVFRAMMEHVRAWMTDGIAPPPSASFDGGGYALLPLPCSTNLPIPGVANIPRDANGNARGGIRLPFLRTTVGNKTVGSPLGAYNGMETQYGCTAGGFPQVAIVTGTFLRNDALIGSYKNHGQYVSGVSKAADHAVGQGWILEEDAEAYASTAAHCVVGKRAPASITIDDLIACHHPPI